MLRKGIYFTDIHWGKKSNSPSHTADCKNFITWVCDLVRADPSIDYVAFLGDWFDNRSAIHVGTLHSAYLGAEQLNDLGIPVFFVVGNHDLHLRNSRAVYSVVPYREFSNFTVIDSPTRINDIKDGVLFVPFMFSDEYPQLVTYSDVPVWAGHFEFQGFRVTGYNVRMEHGPSADQFSGVRRILSGHFHARQTEGNVTYIGNAFPMDYGDVNDNARGCALYDHDTHTVNFIDWPDAPAYRKYLLSDLVESIDGVTPNAFVKCILDAAIEYEDSVKLRQRVMQECDLREFVFEDVSRASTITDEVTGGIAEAYVPDGHEHAGVDGLVVSLLSEISDATIDSSLLVNEYKRLAP